MERRSIFDKTFWNESLGVWRDQGLDDDSLSGSFYGSSFAPLIWRCGQGGVEQDEKFLSTLNLLGVLDYPGGVPTSLWENSTQQWDFPNAWPPLQWMLVAAWHDSPSAVLRDAAEKVAKTWLTTTFLAWEKFNHTMFEKVENVCHTVAVPLSIVWVGMRVQVCVNVPHMTPTCPSHVPPHDPI